MDICTKAISFRRERDCIRILTDAAVIGIWFVTDEIVRIRTGFGMAPEEEFQEASYILQLTAWEDRLDPLFTNERTRVQAADTEVSEQEDRITITGKKLTMTVTKNPLQLTLTDRDGKILYESLAGSAFRRDRGRRITHICLRNEEDHFYGFGEKTGELDKRGRFLIERATDAIACDPQHGDTLYKHIPFYTRLAADSGAVTGFFYNNFSESAFNIGREKSGYLPPFIQWQADDGDVDLFVLAGPTFRDVLDRYTQLTGRPVLLPKRALGYQGSSMYYAELPGDADRAILEFIGRLKEQGFPVDGFHLSSGYTVQGENKRCVFTWNRRRFADPEGFFAAMNAQGAQAVPNVKPGVLCVHPLYEEMAQAGVFITESEEKENRAESKSLLAEEKASRAESAMSQAEDKASSVESEKKSSAPEIAPWWGGPGSFFDFTSPAARELWKKYLTREVIAKGTDSVWNDNCEYDSLADLDARCEYDGAGGTIRSLKPLMSTLMCRIGAEAVRECRQGTRPYVVCRSGSTGIQKYSQNWTGDNVTGWDSLYWNLPTILGEGLSGQPNTGADIGGFAGPAPEEELFLRWVQHGVFQPRFSIHSANSDNTVTEPWMYPAQTERIRQAILLRYRLLPHFYSLEYEAHQCGAPIMRPLVFEFPQDPATWNEGSEFLLGRDLLVANVLEKGASFRDVYLPAGTQWYPIDLINEKTTLPGMSFEERQNKEDALRGDASLHIGNYAGGQTIRVPVTADSIPCFLREGAILPMAADQPMSMEKDAVKDLCIWAVPDCSGNESSYA
ncbi:MAG: DUF4968 domain-containing protein, partial [Lachnospiraceae bacterium]|nr:DUF4968 domain-containing protein [Lachnospiraceae bacterium]